MRWEVCLKEPGYTPAPADGQVWRSRSGSEGWRGCAGAGGSLQEGEEERSALEAMRKRYGASGSVVVCFVSVGWLVVVLCCVVFRLVGWLVVVLCIYLF